MNVAFLTRTLACAACLGSLSAFVMPHHHPPARQPLPVLPVIQAALDALPPPRTMASFSSEAELRGYLRRTAERLRQRAMRHSEDGAALGATAGAAPSAAAPATEARAGITNTQVAGVDEGGIVKLHGNHLVMLRRGRLFTVAVGGNALEPIDAVDAFGPDIDPSGTWYDEMLVAANRVVVIGYSYERGGTEVGVFSINDAGRLRYLSTYQLSSNDYYSSRNYASRLIGTKLIFYAPLYLDWDASDVLASLPAMRRWRGRADERFHRISVPWRVYRPAGFTPTEDFAMHSVTVCDLAAPEMTCRATVALGPSGRVFYVSESAVYVWMSPWSWNTDHPTQRSLLIRMPLDGAAPSAVRVSGAPVDQFSLHESDDGFLNVLVKADGEGDAMWSAEFPSGRASLLRVALSEFGDGTERVSSESYRALPTPEGAGFHNRFVGGNLLYGVGSAWGEAWADSATLFSVPWRGGRISRVELPHGVDRIEVMGTDAVVVGTRGSDLYFSGIALRGRVQLAQQYTVPNASQGELRSHGFFYRADTQREGVLGLPVAGGGRQGWRHLIEGSAAILYLRNAGGDFHELGVLGASGDPRNRRDDACRASCVDWYGNARPVFIGNRIFALMGYELVEGRVANDSIQEVRRVNYAPVVVASTAGH